MDHGHKGISFGTPTCRIPYLTPYIRPTMYVKSSLLAPLYGDSHMFTWPKAHMPSCPCTQTDGLTCIHAYSLVPTCIGTMIYSSRSLLCPLRRPPPTHTQKTHTHTHTHTYIYIYIGSPSRQRHIAHLLFNIASFRAQNAKTHGPADPGLYHPLNSANFNPIDKKRGFVNISLHNH